MDLVHFRRMMRPIYLCPFHHMSSCVADIVLIDIVLFFVVFVLLTQKIVLLV